MLSWKEGGEEIGENIWSEEKNEMKRMKIGIQSDAMRVELVVFSLINYFKSHKI